MLIVVKKLSYPIQPHVITSIGQTKPYAKPSQSNLLSIYIQIIIPYGSNMLNIKKLSHQRAASLLKLENTVNNNSISNAKYAEFSIKE